MTAMSDIAHICGTFPGLRANRDAPNPPSPLILFHTPLYLLCNAESKPGAEGMRSLQSLHSNSLEVRRRLPLWLQDWGWG